MKTIYFIASCDYDTGSHGPAFETKEDAEAFVKRHDGRGMVAGGPYYEEISTSRGRKFPSKGGQRPRGLLMYVP